jgi:hypothetical protein
MGQFYKDTPAQFLDDKMYKAPYELMGQVIDKKDKEIQEDLDSRNALTDLLKAEGLKPDEPRLQQIMKQYQDEIDASVQDIYKDPLNYNKEGVQRLKRKINQDFSLGEIAAIQKNKATYDAWVKSEEEKIKKEPNLYAPGLFDKMKAKKLDDFKKGTSYKGPNEYETVATEEIIGMKDTVDVLDNLMKGAVQGRNHSTSWDNDRGGWRVKSSSSEEFFTPSQLQNMYKDYLATNPTYLQGVAQRQNYDVFGYEGSIDAENGLNFKPGSFFGESMDLLQQKYGGKKTSIGGGKTMNEIGIATEKDKMETVYVDTKLQAEEATVYTNYAGKDTATYNQNNVKNQKVMQDGISTALQLLADKGGYSSIDEMKRDGKYKKSIDAISKGNFSSVSDMGAGRAVEKEYKQAAFRQSALRSTMAEFKKQYPGLDPTKTGGAKYNVKDPATGKVTQMTATDAFNTFLKANYVTKVDASMTWKPTDVSKKQMDGVAKYVVDNGLHMATPITMPTGMIVKGKDGKTKNIGGTQVSLNDLVDLGFFAVEQKEAGRSGDALAGQVITYTDGTNKLNFTVGSTGVVPIWANDDSNNMQFGLKVNVNGQEVTGRISNISTDVVDRVVGGDTGKKMKVVRAISKLGPVEHTFPGGPTYYGKDVYVQGKRVRKKGDVLFQGKVQNISDERTQLFLSQFIE